MATNLCYRAQIRADRRAAACERATKIVASDNARIDGIYTDGYALARHRSRSAPIPAEQVVYPDFDFGWGRVS